MTRRARTEVTSTCYVPCSFVVNLNVSSNVLLILGGVIAVWAVQNVVLVPLSDMSEETSSFLFQKLQS